MKKFPSFVAVLLLIAATFLVYWPALRNGFVWDDTALVLRDPLIRSWRLIPEGFRHFLFLDATASDFYRPMQRLLFTAAYAWFGFEAPWGWHLLSVAVHAAAGVALYFLARKLTQEKNGAIPFLTALIWLVHPIFTSAVTYVAGSADPLAALFGFSALTLGLVSLGGGRRAFWSAAGAALCFLAALLCKESGGAALLIWLLLLVWRRVDRRVWLHWLATMAAVLAVYLGLRFSAERVAPPSSPPTPLPVRPILAARAVAEYAGLLMAPVNLRMERDVNNNPQATFEATIAQEHRREYQTLLGVLLVLGLGVWLRFASRRAPVAAVSLGACFIAYLPISNLISLNATVAEHWLYVPAAFLFLAALLSADAVLKRHALRVTTGALLGCWLVFLGIRTAQQQAAWRDQRAFLEHTIQHGGDTPRMEVNLGNLESSEGSFDLAAAHFKSAVGRAPDLAIAWYGLAVTAIRTRDFSTAHMALEKAAASRFLQPEVLQARSALEHLETGRDTGCILLQAVEAAPKNWPMRRRYIEYLNGAGRTAEAARILRDLLKTEPFRAETWQMLGAALEKLGQPAAAAAAYQKAAGRDVCDAVSRQRLSALSTAAQ